MVFSMRCCGYVFQNRLCLQGQELAPKLALFNYEVSWGFWSSFNLLSSSVWWHGSLAPYKHRRNSTEFLQWEAMAVTWNVRQRGHPANCCYLLLLSTPLAESLLRFPASFGTESSLCSLKGVANSSSTIVRITFANKREARRWSWKVLGCNQTKLVRTLKFE